MHLFIRNFAQDYIHLFTYDPYLASIIPILGEPRQTKSKESKSRKRGAKSDLQAVERKQSTQPPSVQSVDSDGSVGDRKGDDPQRDDDKKVLREQERRFANNARERFVIFSIFSSAFLLCSVLQASL